MKLNSFEVVPFEDIVINYDKKRIPLSSMERSTRQGSYPYYGAQGIIDYLDDYIFEGEYLLIAEDGENLKSKKQNIAQIANGKFWVNNHAHIIKSNEKSDLRYLFYAFNSLDVSGFITGSAQPKLSQGNLNRIPMKIPHIEIQKKIGDILGRLDKKIENNNAVNDNLEKQAQAMFQHLFIDNSNSNWPIGTISDLGVVVGGSTPSKSKPEYYTQNGIAWITPKDLSNFKSKFISHGENDITELGLKNSSASIMPAGTVLFSSRAPIGYIAIAAGVVTTNQGFKSIIPHDHIGTAFVYCFLKHNLSNIENMASGSTFKEVSGSVMKSVPAKIPSAESLEQFTDFCATIFEQQKQLEHENLIVAEMRDILLPKLMSGEIDVSDINI